jgi:hypothetical protein
VSGHRCGILLRPRYIHLIVPSAAAERVASDPKNDLALLRVKRSFAEAATFRSGVPLQAGESVTVVGYPLASILGSEPNVAFGYVSATSGLRGDAASFQISAPIHKGNSGGPILDQAGNVTGIVNAKLDAAAVHKRTGDLPQNISFGIKGEVALLQCWWPAAGGVEPARDAGVGGHPAVGAGILPDREESAGAGPR